MSIREVTYYQVVCDYPACQYSTNNTPSEFSAWSDIAEAEEDWLHGDWIFPAGTHFCNEHAFAAAEALRSVDTQ